jgi:hypothetical protein
VAEDERILSRRQLALHNVQIRAAHAAGANPEKNLPRGHLRLGNIFDLQRLLRSLEDGGFQ